jgi:hypothetical protein
VGPAARVNRRRGALARATLVALVAGISVGCPASAFAHSASDFLKVPVGRVGTVLLPPLNVGPGPAQVTVLSPAGFTLKALDAGPRWRASVAGHQGVLTTAGAPAGPALVTVTGIAAHAGSLPLAVRVTTAGGLARDMTDTLTAAAGYVRPVDTGGAARPDAAVATSSGGVPARAPWAVSGALVAAAAALLLRRRPRQVRPE